MKSLAGKTIAILLMIGWVAVVAPSEVRAEAREKSDASNSKKASKYLGPEKPGSPAGATEFSGHPESFESCRLFGVGPELGPVASVVLRPLSRCDRKGSDSEMSPRKI